MKFQEIKRVEGLGVKEFREQFFKSEIPVVLTDFSKDWEASKRWSFDYFKKEYGNNEVKVYDENFGTPGRKYMSQCETMRFGDYLDKVEKGSTTLRMFLYNIVSKCPKLKDQVSLPAYSKKFSKNFLFMFFGAKDSVTQLHYDIDMSHVFHTVFSGEKTFYLFAPKESKKLYKHPFTIRSYVDVENPDFEKYPALKEVQGHKVTLKPGDTLFIPSGYWHHIRYLSSGFAISLRSPHESFLKRLEGIYNIVVMQLTDRIANKLAPKLWFYFKNFLSKRNAKRFSEIKV